MRSKRGDSGEAVQLLLLALPLLAGLFADRAGWAGGGLVLVLAAALVGLESAYVLLVARLSAARG